MTILIQRVKDMFLLTSDCKYNYVWVYDSPHGMLPFSDVLPAVCDDLGESV